MRLGIQTPQLKTNEIKSGKNHNSMPAQMCLLWHSRLWSFQGRDTKFERFLAKNQLYSNEITKFGEIGVVASCQKVAKFDFQSQFYMSKIIRNFFSLKNPNLGAHFWLLRFFDNINI